MVAKQSKCIIIWILCLFIFFPSSVSAAEVTLSWVRPDDSRVVGYNIYFGESGTNFKSAPGITIDSAAQTSCNISGLVEGVTYEFAATSFDSDVNESDFSEIISYSVPVSGSSPEDTDDDGDGYTENQGDCDDNDSEINPGAIEICDDGLDNDCDGNIDENDSDCMPVCTDADGDGYYAEKGCGTQVDCDDSDSGIHPGAGEICGDGIDQDCSGGDLTCPGDIDDDGDGYTENQGDCDDNDSEINPGAIEICDDGLDNDCDGNIDENDSDCMPVCTDADGDGYYAEKGCGTEIDCNDNDFDVHPGALEECNSKDDDCDGMIDEGIDCEDYNGNGMPDDLEVTDPSSDIDGDGTSDFEDPDSVSFHCINENNEIIAIYACSGRLNDIQNVEDTHTSINQSGKPDNATFPYGVINYKIEGLSIGAEVTVTMVFPGEVNAGAELYKITDSGWHKISYASGESANEIVLTLTDGDYVTDGDETANGTILDPCAIVYASESDGDETDGGGSSGGGGCFISTILK